MWLKSNESKNPIYTDPDVAGGVWLSAAGGKNPVLVDYPNWYFLQSVLYKSSIYYFPDWTSVVSGSAPLPTPLYLYFIASKNPDVNLQATNAVQQPRTNVSSANVHAGSFFTNEKVVYDNGDVKIYCWGS
jgi:hypothetical protein